MARTKHSARDQSRDEMKKLTTEKKKRVKKTRLSKVEQPIRKALITSVCKEMYPEMRFRSCFKKILAELVVHHGRSIAAAARDIMNEHKKSTLMANFVELALKLQNPELGMIEVLDKVTPDNDVSII